MLTPEGKTAIGDLIASWVGDARVFVSDGSQRAEATVNGVYFEAEPSEVVFTATFGSDVANFNWSQRGVIVDGVVIDADEIDGGRKVLGMIREVTVRMKVNG